MSGPDRHEEDRRASPHGAARLVRGLPGHPLHPPLTDLTIGMFVLASALTVIGYVGIIEEQASHGAWLAGIGGLIASVPTASTGFADWVLLEWGSRQWRTATWHLTVMLVAVTLLGLAAWAQYGGYQEGRVTTLGLVLTLSGTAMLGAGGWLGGSLVFVHGVRVLAAGGEQDDAAGVGDQVTEAEETTR